MKPFDDTVPEGHCENCGEPMPPGETMFKYHGYSGRCPKGPLMFKWFAMGSRIAAISNALNLQNDIARRFGLGER